MRAACVLVVLFAAILAVVQVPAATTATDSSGSVLRVDAGGGPYADSDGNTWSADCCNSGGDVYSTAEQIGGTSDQALYQTERWSTGPFSYTFKGLSTGSYRVTLKFAEIAYLGPGKRQFNIEIQGVRVWTNLDVAAEVGLFKALDKTFTATVGSSSQLTIAFTKGAVDNPIVSAIEIAPEEAPTVSSSVSGQPMPVGDVTVNGQAWHQVYTDDFPSSEDTALGATCGDPNGFPHKLSNWDAYSYPWRGTPTWATYCPERTTSIHNGTMDIWLHSETVGGTMQHLIDAPIPRISGAPAWNGQVYGRYVIRYQEPTAFPMFHVSWLLWPDSNVWPQDGEIDFPENDTNSLKTGGYLHWLGATFDWQHDAYEPLVPFAGGWHTAVIEWLPSRVTLYLDGQVIGNTTDTWKISNRGLHWILQANGSPWVPGPDDTSQGHIYIDWVAMYARA